MADITSSSYFKPPKLDNVNFGESKYKVPEYFKPVSQAQDPVVKSLQSQKDNLEKRLQAVGINPDSPEDVDQRNIIERALNLTPDQGLLGDVFEVLDRPVQATKGLIVGGLEGAWKGFSGQEEITGVELLEDTGLVTDAEDLSGVTKFLVNVGTDIALDPLTYVSPMALLKKTGLTKKVTYKNVKKTINQTEKEIAEELKQGIIKNKPGKSGKTITKNNRRIYTKKELDTDWIEISNPNSTSKVKVYQKGEVASPTSAGGKTETAVRDRLAEKTSEKLSTFSDRLVVMAEDPGNNLADIRVGLRVKLQDGTEAVAELKRLEVKGAFKAKEKAFGKTITAKFEKNGISLGTSKISNNLKRKYENILKDKIFKDGTSFTDIFKKAAKLAKSGKNPTEAFTKAQKIELAETMRQLTKDAADSKYILGINDADQLVAYSADEVLELADFGFGVDKTDSGNVRFLSDFGKDFAKKIPLDQLEDVTDDLVNSLIQTKDIDIVEEVVTPGITARILDTKMFKENKFLAGSVDFAKRVYYTVGYAFNATLGTSKTFQASIRRIGGENAQRLHQQTTKILKMKKELTKQSDNAGKLIHEIAEAVAERNAGVITLKNRMFRGDKLVDNIYQMIARGNEAIIPTPNMSEALIKGNILDPLNDAVEYAGIKFNLISEKGYTRVILEEGNIADLADILKAGDASGLRNLNFNFGKSKLSKEATDFYSKNFKEIDELLKIQDEMSGLLVKELGYKNLPKALQNQVGYIRHYMTDAAKKGLKGQVPFQDANFLMAGTEALKKRSFLGTADEMNNAIKDLYDMDFDVIGTDAFTAVEELVRVTLTKREQWQTLELILNQADEGAFSMFKAVDNTREAKELLGEHFVAMNNGFKGEFGDIYKNLSEQSQDLLQGHLESLGLKPGKALVMHRSAYGLLNRINRSYKELPVLVKSFDRFVNYWKGITLVSPGFHLRNAFGNTFNQYAAGMNVADIGKYNMISSNSLNRFKNLAQTVADGGFDAMNKADQTAYLEVIQYFEDGISQTRKGVRDLEKLKDTVMTTRGAQRNQAAQAYQSLLEVNFNVAERMDDVQRFALYKWALDTQTEDVVRQLKAANASDEVIKMAKRRKAGEIVEEALFDYTNLTSFEKEYMKRLFPFYTFMKNNFIFQMKAMVKNPKAYARLGRAYDYWNEDVAGISTEEMPDYMQDNMWLPIPMTVSKDDKEAINYLKLNLTPSDFAELVANPLKRGIESLAAPIKVPLEIGMGVDTFTQRPLTDFPGQTKIMQEGKGALPFMRDESGNLAVFRNPVFRKVMDDFGLRVPRNYVSITFDIIDTLGGYQPAGELTSDLSKRFSLTGLQTQESIQLSELYRDLEYLRNLRSLYEQENNAKLPSLEELGE